MCHLRLTVCTTRLTLKVLRSFPTQCIYVFRAVLRTHSDYFPVHQLAGCDDEFRDAVMYTFCFILL
jgi:hypothetical protein